MLELRESGLKVEMEHTDRSLKAQLRRANKLNARYAVIVGEDEVKKNVVLVKDLLEKRQFELSPDVSKLKELAEAVE